MNETKMKKLLNLYYENNDMAEYSAEKDEQQTAQRYRSMNYTLETAIQIMLDIPELWIVCTKVFKRRETATIVRVYKDNNSMEETNLYCTYFPVGDFLEMA